MALLGEILRRERRELLEPDITGAGLGTAEGSEAASGVETETGRRRGHEEDGDGEAMVGGEEARGHGNHGGEVAGGGDWQQEELHVFRRRRGEDFDLM